MRCERCLLQHCLCAEIPTVTTQTRVVIVRHHDEVTRASNTGRLAHLALPNSELVDHDGPSGAARLPALEGMWLVFPAGPVAEAPLVPAPRAIVVLDGTWRQARRMYRKLDGLRGLPMLRLPDAPMPSARLRNSPGPGQVSTIEAIARALRLLEGDAVAVPLEQLFELAVARAAQSGRQMR
ncbi:MAG: DTW domain-containing protein [Myxococcota bacterium]|nr:DTW domain-containing protein [Deltaproteobacteria bacterium]MDQ3337349.1 DTW domain-containing protein [Myxococcota bacterium]